MARLKWLNRLYLVHSKVYYWYLLIVSAAIVQTGLLQPGGKSPATSRFIHVHESRWLHFPGFAGGNWGEYAQDKLEVGWSESQHFSSSFRSLQLACLWMHINEATGWKVVPKWVPKPCIILFSSWAERDCALNGL